MPPKARGKGSAIAQRVKEIQNQQQQSPAPSAKAAPPSYSATTQPKKSHADPSSASGTTNTRPGFLPPGACDTSRSRKNAFSKQFEHHFMVPGRLMNVPTPLVEAVNDFHYAMMNDRPRNHFYHSLLRKHIVPGETTVLEIGAGSGLLSMMAAQLGAKWVVAVEGSADMAQLARQNINENGLQDKIQVLNMLSTDLTPKHLPSAPDVLVSEIFGTLLLGESALDYIQDVRKRVLKPTTKIIPQHGVQYAVPIECPVLEDICSVSTWNGLNLKHVTALKDTASVVFTKKFGFRMSSVPFKRLTEPIPVLSIDFAKSRVDDFKLNRTFSPKIIAPGKAHAMMLYWKSVDDGENGEQAVMSTDPEDTLDNFARDMQWGQALQLLDGGGSELPTDVVIAEGDVGKPLPVQCRATHDRVVLQFEVGEGNDDDEEWQQESGDDEA